MPIIRTIHAHLNLAIVHYEGTVNFDIMQQNIKIVRAMDGFTPTTRVLIIFGPSADVSQFSAIEIERLASISPMSENKTQHLIMAPESLSFGLARMFAAQQNNESADINIVRTIAEACAIFNIDSELLLHQYSQYDKIANLSAR